VADAPTVGGVSVAPQAGQRAGGIRGEQWGFFTWGSRSIWLPCTCCRSALCELASRSRERWWREVILLLVGAGNRKHSRFMAELLAPTTGTSSCFSPAWGKRRKLGEASARALGRTPGRDRQTAVLSALRGRKDEELIAYVERLLGEGDPSSGRPASWCSDARALWSRARGAAPTEEYDLCLIASRADAPQPTLFGGARAARTSAVPESSAQIRAGRAGSPDPTTGSRRRGAGGKGIARRGTSRAPRH